MTHAYLKGKDAESEKHRNAPIAAVWRCMLKVKNIITGDHGCPRRDLPLSLKQLVSELPVIQEQVRIAPRKPSCQSECLLGINGVEAAGMGLCPRSLLQPCPDRFRRSSLTER